MLRHPAIVAVLLVLGGLVLLALWSGWRDRSVDFIHRRDVHAPAGAGAALLFDRVVPVLVDDGYAMVARAGNTTIFERRFTLAWTVLAAIFLFPVGLLALLVRGRETIVIVSRDDLVEVHGRCGKLTADFVVAAADEAALGRAPV